MFNAEGLILLIIGQITSMSVTRMAEFGYKSEGGLGQMAEIQIPAEIIAWRKKGGILRKQWRIRTLSWA
jgi:hypothetical protein